MSRLLDADSWCCAAWCIPEGSGGVDISSLFTDYFNAGDETVRDSAGVAAAR